MKTALVAGGAGFIGSHLCARLLQEGYRVICVDNLVTGQKKHIARLAHHEQFLFITHDVCDPLVFDEPVDEVYNLASPASPPQYQKDPVKTLLTNTTGTAHLLAFAKEKKAVFFQASTSEVYGDPLEHPQLESYRGNVNPIGPRACYDEGKRAAETLCFDYHRMYGLPIKVVRIFNTYGPQMDAEDGRVVSNFIVQALKQKPLSVYGDGLQTRSFCYVDDLVSGFLAFMKTDESVTGPLNMGNPEEYTVLDLAKKIIALTGSQSSIVHETLPVDDPVRRRPDIAKAKDMLGWSPVVSVDEGLTKTIAYFRTEVEV